MKDSCAMTLFRRLAAFPWCVPLALVVFVVASARAADASDYSALISCGTTPPVSNSPVPFGQIGSGDGTGAGVYAGSPLKGEVHAGAPAPNAPRNDIRDCSADATAKFTDVVIQGPAASVVARLHVPFHANIFQDWTEMSDGTNLIFSFNNTNVTFRADLFGGPVLAQAGLEIRWNRQALIHQVIPFVANGAEFVPRPRIPGLPAFDSDGFVTQFFQRSTPVTRSNPAFAGFKTNTIDEARGEIILTAQVPTNFPLTLALNINIRATATANFFAGAFGAIDQTSLSVPIDGAVVFELPDGFTAQIPSAGVINNVVPQLFKCTHTFADWLGRPADWPLPVMTFGGQIYNQDDLLGILKTATSALRPDVSVVLAQQLIAARLNEANGSAPGPMLQPSMVADSLLSGFGGKLPYRVNPATATGQQMMNIAIQLNNYNAGRLTAACVP